MFIRGWKKELFTIPNLLSLFRLVLIPVYIRMYLKAESRLDYYVAGSILGLSCLTDLADGKIARACNMVSNLGKLLDPLADKLTQLVLILSLAKNHRILYPMLSLFLIKELFQCISLLIFIRKGKVLPGALLSGKVCTTALFVSLILLVLFPQIPGSTVRLLVLADCMFLLYAFGDYAGAYFGKSALLTDLEQE